jgi:predicted CoA-binding protein
MDLEPVDLVQLFRPSDSVLPFVQSAIAIGARVIWMQLGIENHAAAELERAAGIEVVMDRCMMVDHLRFLGA